MILHMGGLGVGGQTLQKWRVLSLESMKNITNERKSVHNTVFMHGREASSVVNNRQRDNKDPRVPSTESAAGVSRSHAHAAISNAPTHMHKKT